MNECVYLSVCLMSCSVSAVPCVQAPDVWESGTVLRP